MRTSILINMQLNTCTLMTASVTSILINMQLNTYTLMSASVAVENYRHPLLFITFLQALKLFDAQWDQNIPHIQQHLMHEGTFLIPPFQTCVQSEHICLK